MKHIISLGAGVQSSTMALMAAHGEITPMPDCAIFADTGAEPQAVYDWLDWLETKLPFPVHRVQEAEGLYANILSATDGDRFAGAPFFAKQADGQVGMLRRQCTREFKITPIHRFIRKQAGLKPRQRAKGVIVSSWHGISLDEIQRARGSMDKWMEIRYPLIEKRMTRHECMNWLTSHGYEVPMKSACTFCPYRDDEGWRDMKLNDPDSFAQAVEVDERIRAGVTGTHSALYVHRSGIPLSEVDLRNAADHGQSDMFDEECEGMCGL